MPQKDLALILSPVDVDELLRLIQVDEDRKSPSKYQCQCCRVVKTNKRYFIDHLSKNKACCRAHLRKRRAMESAPPVNEVAIFYQENVDRQSRIPASHPREEDALSESSFVAPPTHRQRLLDDADNITNMDDYESAHMETEDDFVTAEPHVYCASQLSCHEDNFIHGDDDDDSNNQSCSDNSNNHLGSDCASDRENSDSGEDDSQLFLCPHGDASVDHLEQNQSTAVVTKTTVHDLDEQLHSLNLTERCSVGDDSTISSRDSYIQNEFIDDDEADIGLDPEMIEQLRDAAVGEAIYFNRAVPATGTPIDHHLSGAAEANEYENLNKFLPDPKCLPFHPKEAELLSIFKEHDIPPEIYNQIMRWARSCLEVNYHFTSKSYKTIMKAVKKHYLPSDCDYYQTEIVIDGMDPIKQYVFRIEPQLKRVLSDKTLAEKANWEFTPKFRDGEREYGESNTAGLFEAHCQKIREKISPDDPELRQNSPLVIACFDDATSCAKVDRIGCHFVMASILNIPLSHRFSTHAVMPLGIIPNYPKSAKERGKAGDESYKILKFYQEALRNIYGELHELEKKTLKVILPNGMPKILHPKFGFCIGDTKGHDDMVCRYNSHSACIKKMSRDCDIPGTNCDDPYYDCVPTDMGDVIDAIREYHLAKADKNKSAVKAADKVLDSLSQKPVHSILFEFEFAGLPGGIFGFGTPFEILHVLYIGIMKLLLTGIFHIMKVPDPLKKWYSNRLKGHPLGALAHRPDIKSASKNKATYFPVEEFERRMRLVQSQSRRQSDRFMPRSPFKNGVTELTRLNGQEYPGLCLLTIPCLKGIFHASKHYDKKDGILMEKKLSLLLLLALSLEVRLTKDNFKDTELDVLEKDIRLFLYFFACTIGIFIENLSKSGLRRVKFHALIHFPRLIRLLGSHMNFFGGTFEALLKFFVKHPVQRTSKKHHKYQKEILDRYTEWLSVHEHNKLMKEDSEYRKEIQRMYGIDEPGRQASVRSRTTFRSSQKSKRRYDFTGAKFWCDYESNGQWSTYVPGGKCVARGRCVHPGYPNNAHKANSWVQRLTARARELAVQDGRDYDRVLFMYIVDVPTTVSSNHDRFLCHPNYDGRPWHDWCMVRFAREKGGGDYITAAKLLLWGVFVDKKVTQMNTHGVPAVTPEFLKEHSYRQGEDDEVMEDPEPEPTPLFAVVHSLKRVGGPPKDSVLPFGGTDVLATDINDVNFDAVEESAFVLPICNKREDVFPDKDGDKCAYWVVPPRASWGQLGWSDKLLDKYRGKITTKADEEMMNDIGLDDFD